MTSPHRLIDGRYRQGQRIGRGGMATVYRATDTRLEREVAVKIMHPHLAENPGFRSRFDREAKAAAQLHHPNLVSVYDTGIDGDDAYLVMELIDGGTLRELLKERGRMPAYAMVAVLFPVLAALEAAHGRGLIHRDIKPDNILIDQDGAVKLTDFGLVRSVEGDSHPVTSAVMGTAAYVAPEQLDGREVDFRTDLYGLGIVAFEMLTATVPFTGSSQAQVIHQRLTQDVPAPSSVQADIPLALDEFVLRLAARHPNDRFPSAAAATKALQQIVRQLRLPAFTVPAPQRSASQRAASRAVEDERTAHIAPGAVPEVPDAADAETFIDRLGRQPFDPDTEQVSASAQTFAQPSSRTIVDPAPRGPVPVTPGPPQPLHTPTAIVPPVQQQPYREAFPDVAVDSTQRAPLPPQITPQSRTEDPQIPMEIIQQERRSQVGSVVAFIAIGVVFCLIAVWAYSAGLGF